MMINATFFVQILHFALAYFFIDRILLRFVVHVVRLQAREEHHRVKQIEHEQHMLELLQKKIITRWQEWQRAFSTKKPNFISEQPEFLRESVLTVEQPDRKKVIEMRNVLAHAIVNRLGTDHDNN